MLDFKLTDRGDIIVEESKEVSARVRIDFMLSNSKPIRINFDLDNFKEKIVSPFKVQFEVNGDTEKYRCETIQGVNALQQACLIRLETELGDMKRSEWIGSRMQSVRHKPLYDLLIQNQIKEIAQEAIKDILPKAKITVTPHIDKTCNRYEQNAIVSIYDEDTIVANYKVRG